MRPIRLLVSLSTSFTAIILVLYLVLNPSSSSKYPNREIRKSDGVKALFSFTSPGSLFPPSAIISLTDDNSTFFLARPAAFGPPIDTDGLSSPLWTGNGFGDDASHSGELGCSDTAEDDNRDGDLTYGLDPPEKTAGRDVHASRFASKKLVDVRGAIVLLKRGGCGFLAKVQWAQDRGAVAVIVGDNVRGGGLIRMYAKGDTSNITIPSVFTSHTTAHLLSSLVPTDDTTTATHNTQSHSSRSLAGRLRWTKWALPYESRPRISTLSKSKNEVHKGLWITLTPTNVSTSPFLDTLLVLVVSPLVTLTVVYALLLLRSRIRRRRWRAPKSLVERLPVRTYQTIRSPSSSASSSLASSTVNPRTPLLQGPPAQPVPLTPGTTAEYSTAPSASTSPHGASGRTREEEKREAGLAEWRRRYGGRQRECVVCLEEYEDGVSQVMSLPCGHEFHAECITPWLVTRRRTCPICKGDVVRSLAQSYHDRLPSPPPTHARMNGTPNSDDVQAQVAEARNDSPASALPIPAPSSDPSLQLTRSPDDAEADWDADDTRALRTDSTSRRHEQSGLLNSFITTMHLAVSRRAAPVRNSAPTQGRLAGDVDRDR